VKAISLVQRVLGFSFLAFGLCGFINSIPHIRMQNVALEFFLGLAATGYMLPLLYAVQATAGALLLVGLFVPLALALLAPLIVNIFFFHLFLAPRGIPVALILVAFELALVWTYRSAYAPMLQPITVPDGIDSVEVVRKPATA